MSHMSMGLTSYFFVAVLNAVIHEFVPITLVHVGSKELFLLFFGEETCFAHNLILHQLVVSLFIDCHFKPLYCIGQWLVGIGLSSSI